MAGEDILMFDNISMYVLTLRDKKRWGLKRYSQIFMGKEALPGQRAVTLDLLQDKLCI